MRAAPKPRSLASASWSLFVAAATLGVLGLAGVAASGCTQLVDSLLGVDGGSGTTDAGAAAATSVSYPDGSTSELGVGTNCGTEVTTGVVLCTGVSTCPDITVDQTTYLGCGFRLSEGSYDLECGCNGYLCPVGTPTSCAEASSLLSGQNVSTVCAQVTEGRCVQPNATTTSTTTTATATTTSTCDQSCAATCVGAAPCLQLCGC